MEKLNISRNWILEKVNNFITNQGEENLLFITGKVGTGKTHICQQITQTLSSKRCVYYFDQKNFTVENLKNCLFRHLRLNINNLECLIVIDQFETYVNFDSLRILNYFRDLSKCFKIIISCQTNYFLKLKLSNQSVICLDFNKTEQNQNNECILNDLKQYVQLNNFSSLHLEDFLFKSECNFLYISKIIDLINLNYINLKDVFSIPDGLNGLHLFLIKILEEKLSKSDFYLAKLVLNLLAINSDGEIKKNTIYKCIKSKDLSLELSKFEQVIQVLQCICLKNERNGTKLKFFHSNFLNWLIKENFLVLKEAYHLKCIFYWSELCNYKCQINRTSTPLEPLNYLINLKKIDESNLSKIEPDEKSQVNFMSKKHTITLKKFKFYLEKCNGYKSDELFSTMGYYLDLSKKIKQSIHMDPFDLSNQSSILSNTIQVANNIISTQNKTTISYSNRSESKSKNKKSCLNRFFSFVFSCLK
ncbi:unnamed protein product [Brachionus calyciflorus]|uniref:Nephrocystin 3-like N-terminal domain-containing protein n=1 Tax=Brachionus calyciflorus TaxID=104777 RepID=A0A813TDB1_9BILA|nr:unnamed protein product [Brachionus calyciflorus]